MPVLFELPALVLRLLAALPDDVPVALAGGAVRDLLLDRPVHDYDFIVPKDAMRTARKLADKIGAAYFPLDEQRDYARLVLQDGARILIDFSAYQGADIETDLRGRDFTINAIAVNLRDPSHPIDPTGGANDLIKKQIVPCSPASLRNDPVRVLRGVRLANDLGARLPPETLKLMRETVPLLSSVSVERQRDELFKILNLHQASAAVRILDTLGALPYVLPELTALKGLQQSAPHVNEAWEHTLDLLNRLQSILDVLSSQYEEEGAGSLILGMAVLKLGRYRTQIAGHFAEQLNPDRSLRALLNFAALYHDVGKPLTRTVDAGGRTRFFEHDHLGADVVVSRAHALRLSNEEIERLHLIVYHHMRPSHLAHSGLPTRKAVYHYFKELGEAGVDVCLLSLADTLATYGATLPQDKWAGLLDVVRTLLENWWERPQEAIAPQPLVNGHDLMQSLGIKPGPHLGELLEAIREAQAEGLLATRDEALAFAAKYSNHPSM